MTQLSKTLVVSYRQPDYSEVWMDRMTNMLRPNVEAVYALKGRSAVVGSREITETYLLSGFISRLPARLAVGVGRRIINREMSRVLELHSPETTVLVHYLTMAVGIREAIQNCQNPVFVHCHGFDVTWNRKNERMPFLPDHFPSYVRRVQELSKRVRFIANSNATAEKLRDIGIADQRISVKYIGAPIPSDFRPLPASANGITILFLGRLMDFKGPVETIQAFAKARQLGLKGRLIIAGGGHQRSACVGEIQKHGIAEYVDLLGPVPATRARELMSQASIFTAHNQRSSRTGQEEAFGVSVIEAMACGVPVVTGRSGGVCETVVDGETGFLFKPGDIEAHAAALLRLANDKNLRDTLGSNGHQRACRLFSLEEEQRRLREILFSQSPGSFSE